MINVFLSVDNRTQGLSQKRSQEPTDQPLIDNSLDDKNSNNMSSTAVEGADSQTAQHITIFRPLTALPLFDYPLRRLFTEVLSVDQFLVCYCCALIESQILIMSSNYYTLMLTAEALTQLLNPFKWQHVYVPILPQKLGILYSNSILTRSQAFH